MSGNTVDVSKVMCTHFELYYFVLKVETLISSRDFPVLKNDSLLRTARGLVPKRLPVWIMRQAGRYLPGCVLNKVQSFLQWQIF